MVDTISSASNRSSLKLPLAFAIVHHVLLQHLDFYLDHATLFPVQVWGGIHDNFISAPSCALYIYVCASIFGWLVFVATLLLEECEDDTHTHEMGTWESTGIPKTSELDCRGQNTLHWDVCYIIENLSKRRCRKWARMSHLDIFSTSYGKKKGWESNWQFDSRPLKVRNWPDPGACRWCVTHHWKDLDESYKFSSDLIPIGGLSRKL
jgi:hypothetical protein